MTKEQKEKITFMVGLVIFWFFISINDIYLGTVCIPLVIIIVYLIIEP